jgi:VanZ like family
MRLFVISVSFILLCTLYPFQFNWNGYSSFTDLLWGFEQRLDIRDFLLNIVLFMPLGLSLNGLPSRWKKLGVALVICMGLSTTVEVLQMALPGRNPNLLDIVSNSLGGLLGYRGDRRWSKPLGDAIQRFGNIRLPVKWLLAAFLGYFSLVLSLAIALPSASSLASWDSQMPLLLGNEKSGDRPWAGLIADVYFSDRAWSEAQIQRVLASEYFEVREPVIAAYSLSKGAYQDQAGNLPELVWQGTSGIQTEQGVRLDAEHWLATPKPAARLAERIRDSSEFTVVTAIATANLDQTGPARIISQSESPFSRNLTLGQERSDLHIRLRTFANDGNGSKPYFIIPNFFTDTELHRFAVTYKGATMRVDADPSRVYTFDFPTDFNSGSTEKFMLYYSLLFVPLGFLAAMVIRSVAVGRLSRWRVWFLGLGIILPSWIVEGILAVESSRNIRFINGLIGVLFMGATALIYWMISSDPSFKK